MGLKKALGGPGVGSDWTWGWVRERLGVSLGEAWGSPQVCLGWVCGTPQVGLMQVWVGPC